MKGRPTMLNTFLYMDKVKDLHLFQGFVLKKIMLLELLLEMVVAREIQNLVIMHS